MSLTTLITRILLILAIALLLLRYFF